MPRMANVFGVLVASPSDVAEERRAIGEVVASWNVAHSRASGAILEPVKWESHARPASGGPPQQIINRQIVDDCDLLIGVFWTRIGTPTEEAASGTIEEIERFVRAGKPVMLYFSNRPVVPDSIDMEQYGRLTEFKRNWMSCSGVAFEYEDIVRFREILSIHLAGAMHDLHIAAPPPPKSVSEVDILTEEFDRCFTHLRVKWNAEKESEPYSTDDAKFLLQDATERMLDLRAHRIIDSNPGPRGLLDTAIRKMKELQKHEVFCDGGVSYGEFWLKGDQVIDVLGNFPTALRSALEKAIESVGGVT